jgi:outer membrane protein assembly factor BamB
VRRRTLLIALALGLLVAGTAAAGAVYVLADRRPGDVLDTNAPFVSEPEDPPATTQKATDKNEKKQPKGPDYGASWPFYGRNPAHTRDASQLTAIRPPYHVRWQKYEKYLLEYPPSYHRGVLYLTTGAGWVIARNARTGKKLWDRHLRTELVNQPAYYNGRIYFGSRSEEKPFIYALEARTGRTAWKIRTGERYESPPVVAGDRLFIGSIDGGVRAVNPRTGRTFWRADTDGEVKSSLAVHAGRVYFGDYAGAMYSLRASDGGLVWKTQTNGLASGFSSGNFYATPAVRYGRVYIANTDYKIYSFVAATGEIAWTQTLPYWAYGSPAVSDGRVFGTSFDGTLIALDARTGRELWRFRFPNGRSLASPTVIGRYVYAAQMGRTKRQKGNVYAFNPGNGRVVWKFRDGQYSSVIPAGDLLILAGYAHLYALEPRERR